VQVAACRNSLENLGLTEDQMLPATVVQGGVEVATRIAEGWDVLTF
jgi:intracellular sulfur oxidation DsrE/DsrF family protein